MAEEQERDGISHFAFSANQRAEKYDIDNNSDKPLSLADEAENLSSLLHIDHDDISLTKAEDSCLDEEKKGLIHKTSSRGDVNSNLA